MQNGNVVLRGRRLTLVPYLPLHVPRYHQWMSDPELLEATCSEPLTLAEEFENQRSWLASTDKLTFVLLAPLSLLLSDPKPHGAASPVVPSAAEHVGEAEDTNGARLLLRQMKRRVADLERSEASSGPTGAASDATVRLGASPLTPSTAGACVSPQPTALQPEGPLAMIGDCNAFISPNESGVAEVEVSLAEKPFRGRGLAKEAVQLLMSYLFEQLGVAHYVAKILASNDASIQLFSRGLGFTKFKDVPCFGEVHYELQTTAAAAAVRREECGYRRDQYIEGETEANVIHGVPADFFDAVEDSPPLLPTRRRESIPAVGSTGVVHDDRRGSQSFKTNANSNPPIDNASDTSEDC